MDAFTISMHWIIQFSMDEKCLLCRSPGFHGSKAPSERHPSFAASAVDVPHEPHAPEKRGAVSCKAPVFGGWSCRYPRTVAIPINIYMYICIYVYTCLKCLISHDIKDVYLYMYVSCVYIAPTKLISKLVLGTRSQLASHSKDHPSQVSPIKSSCRFADMAVTRAIHQILPRKTRRTSQSPSNVDACRFINPIWYFNLTRVWNLHRHHPRNHPSGTFQEIANLWNHHLRSLLSRSIQSLPSGTSGTFQEIMNFQWLYNLNIPQERRKNLQIQNFQKRP